MAELCSDFLFNPLGSSRAHPRPGPPCSPGFHVSDPAPARLLDRSSHLAMASYQGCFSTGFPTRRRVPRGSGGASSTQECLLVSLGNREVCRDALDLSCTPGRNRGPWSSGQGRSNSPLLPSQWKPQLLSSFFLPSSDLWSGACSERAFLKPEEGGVTQAAPQDRLQTGWDGFPGIEDFTISPARSSLREDGRLLSPPPPATPPSPASTTGHGDPPALCWGTVRDFFTSDGFSERDFRAGATEM